VIAFPLPVAVGDDRSRTGENAAVLVQSWCSREKTLRCLLVLGFERPFIQQLRVLRAFYKTSNPRKSGQEQTVSVVLQRIGSVDLSSIDAALFLSAGVTVARDA
jgi:hypothetical protein